MIKKVTVKEVEVKIYFQLDFRFHKIYYYLFIYYLGRGDGGGNNNDQENDGGGEGGEGGEVGEVGEVGCERNPIAIGKFLTFHFSFY